MSDRGISRIGPSTFAAAISDRANKGLLDSEPYLKLHIEPGRPIEVSTLTHALGSLSRQYQGFILDQGLFDKAGEAKLACPRFG